MSGRFTFTAGNTLTAAQINTNVMDGIPYKMICGQVSVTGSLAVTFPASFTSAVVPTITANVASGTSNRTSVTFSTPTNTAATFYVWTGATAATVAGVVHYTAIQMTSTTGTGNS
jgi:hypothetical protein